MTKTAPEPADINPQVIVSASGGIAETVYSTVESVIVDWDDIRDGNPEAINAALDSIRPGHSMRGWLLKHMVDAGVSLVELVDFYGKRDNNE